MTRSGDWAVVWGLVLLAPIGCQVRKPIVTLDDIKLKSIGSGKVDLVLHFDVFNTNTYDIKLKSFDYALAGGGIELVKGATREPIGKLKALTSTVIATPAEVSYSNIFRALRRARTDKDEPTEYRLTGTAHFDILGLDIPVALDKCVTVEPIRLPRWRLIDVRVPEDRDRPVALIFQVENPNAFELPVVALSGAILLGGKPIVEIDRPDVTSIPPGQTREVALPVRLNVANLARAVAAAASRGQVVKFKGNFKLDPPVSLRSGAKRIKDAE